MRKTILALVLMLSLSMAFIGIINAEESKTLHFTDVNGSSDKTAADYQYFYEPVYWAVEKGITNGYSDGSFGVGKECTRAATMIFLWRYVGCPAPEKDAREYFTDLPAYGTTTATNQAIAWGYENGITKGYSDGTFGINASITRKDVLILIYRCAGKPEVEESSKVKFSDCAIYKEGTDTYNAIIWGATNGITAGYTDGTFRPLINCLREQIITFLYRFDKVSNSNVTGEVSTIPVATSTPSITSTPIGIDTPTPSETFLPTATPMPTCTPTPALSITDVISNAEVGSTITYGSYEQDGNSQNGSEPIEWIVIRKDGNKILVLSKYILDCYQFHNSNNRYSVCWRLSLLRTWLNGTFQTKAFSTTEKNYISSVSHDCGTSKWNTYENVKVTDQVFLLSVGECEELSLDELKGYATEYAISQGCSSSISENDKALFTWWLRTSGQAKTIWSVDSNGNRTGQDVMYRCVVDMRMVYYNGSMLSNGYPGQDLPTLELGVRPAMWLDPDQ